MSALTAFAFAERVIERACEESALRKRNSIMDEFASLEQRSEAWHAARVGRVTASRIADVCARTKDGWGASRQNYLAELVVERLSGQSAESGYQSPAMLEGIEREPQARSGYEFLTGATVDSVGFAVHPRLPQAGCSPDGLVGDEGMIQIKSPQLAAHIKTLINSKVENKYQLQMQWEMSCTGRQWSDYISFNPDMPHGMDIWITRIERDDAKISELEEIVTEFLAEVDQTVARLRERYMQEAA